MPRLKWEMEKENEGRTCCYSSDKNNHFYGSYWKHNSLWYAHICPRDSGWYIKEFPLDTSETKIKKGMWKTHKSFWR